MGEDLVHDRGNLVMKVRIADPTRKRSHPRRRYRPNVKRKMPPGARRKSSLLRVFRALLLTGFVAGVCFVAGGYLGLVRSVGQLDAPQNTETHPTYIYSAPLGDSDGSRRVIGTIFQGQNRKMATLDDMPSHLLNALVAKEDERFREHAGVDLWGIMRALWVDVRAGKAVEGASTITQQYVRNAHLSRETTIRRKVKEALIAIQIETVKEKDEILANYLNTAYFGNNAYGIEAASETYFDKSVDDLTVAESATLVGLVWSPSTLGEDKEAAREQRDLVLEKMFSTGYVNQQDYDEALKEEMPKEWPEAPMIETGLTGPPVARDFVGMVYDDLVNRYGAATVSQGGLSVYTTLDLEAQEMAREVLYGPAGYLSDPSGPDAALVSVEPETGRIRAMVGNRDPNARFNLVTQGRRQPGSSFKLFTLIAALEQGIDPDTRFMSEDKVYELDAGGGETERWSVENYEQAERGLISLREALWESDNTVFTDLILNVGGKGLENGPEATVDVAKRLGISADWPERPNPSVVLGTQEVSPLDMARAYAAIENEGRLVEPTAVEKVVSDRKPGKREVLFEADETPKAKQVMDPEVARRTVEIMTGTITRGISTEASLGDRPAAGKTGTSENFFDSWFVGFTPQLSTAVWMGYSEGGKTLEPLLSSDGSRHGTLGSPEEIWRDYMLRTLADEPIKGFQGQDGATENEGESRRDTGA
jgi:membrane peptidoglycan carboxypeptidase